MLRNQFDSLYLSYNDIRIPVQFDVINDRLTKYLKSLKSLKKITFKKLSELEMNDKTTIRIYGVYKNKSGVPKIQEMSKRYISLIFEYVAMSPSVGDIILNFFKYDGDINVNNLKSFAINKGIFDIDHQLIQLIPCSVEDCKQLLGFVKLSKSNAMSLLCTSYAARCVKNTLI